MAVGDAEKGGLSGGKHAEEVFDELAGAEVDANYERYKNKNFLARWGGWGGRGDTASRPHGAPAGARMMAGHV